jgi:hypothetical protein
LHRCVPPLAFALALALVGGCAPPTVAGQAGLALAFERLAWVDPAFGHYEAFVVAGGKPYSLGAFNVSPMGPLVALDGSPKTSWTAPVAPSAIEEVLVTQEAPDDADPAPSRQVFLRGSVSAGKATLAPPVAVERFAGATGGFILDNPATEKDLDDFNGIWFSKLEGKRYLPGLDIPQAPPGSMYAGWLVAGRTVLRLGKFSHNRENDDFYGYSGLDSVSLPVNFNGPPMPGEDFVKNLPPGFTGDLSGAQVIISLESATLAGEDAFAGPLHVLEGWVPTPGAPRTSYPLENVAAKHFPAGTAVLQ